MAEKQLENQTGGVTLPSIIQPNVFATFAWDNIDILEETLSGKGTTHCTNGIVIQRKLAGCEPPPKPVEVEHGANRRRRPNTSLNIDNNQILPYNAGKRAGPQPVDFNMNASNEEFTHAREDANLKDFVWFLTRVTGPSLFVRNNYLQAVPSWSAFNSKTRSTGVPNRSLVGYSQMLDAKATELSPVYTVVKKFMAMVDAKVYTML